MLFRSGYLRFVHLIDCWSLDDINDSNRASIKTLSDLAEFGHLSKVQASHDGRPSHGVFELRFPRVLDFGIVGLENIIKVSDAAGTFFKVRA